MTFVVIIFVAFMIGKDVTFVPYPDLLRGMAQSLCLAAGIAGASAHLSGAIIARYWSVLAYLLILLIATPLNSFGFYVLLQILSLLSVIIFSIALFDGPRQSRDKQLRILVFCILSTYGAIIIASLLMAQLQPNLAYEQLFAGNETGYEIRFRGMFSKSGGMAVAAGLLVGLAAISARRWWSKAALVVPGLICLVLTQSRSFWMASLVAGSLTAWMYFPNWRKRLFAGMGLAFFVVLTYIAFNITVDTTGVRSFARLGTVSDLTGRTELWDFARNAWSGKPWLGYGYTLGGLGLQGDRTISFDVDPRQFSRQTLHSGYIQSAMDSGILGLLFYTTTIVLAISRVARYDKDRQYPEVLYVLVFLAIANFGESVIYSGAVFQSLCFWIFAVFALGLGKRDFVRSKEILANPLEPGHGGIPRFTNLMR
jgi:exopolysaccharide production protein ExoQ